ncbi:hypothetical protein SAMN02799620_04487 [Mycolicibacterium fluoranthenivorans]|uniref:Uncharacterized protein n=1 Tax=Mycolicibacterium fluoranthenivorans TaxID=258505 RepID=A0A1G4WRL4_9MYCO|nr:hypothetical protein SAMN02799620_04487 [Mycolicibacterium fluoranthenivorans]
MHLSILHDATGNVLGLAASPPGAPVSHLQGKAGELTTVVDMTEELRGVEPSEMASRLADIVVNYRVAMPTSRAQLVKK